MIGAVLGRGKARRGKLTVDGRPVRLEPSRLIGQGGEAEVYDLGRGIALKRFKPPDHADFAHSPEAQQAAGERLVVHQQKIPALLKLDLPSHVVAPLAPVLDEAGAIAGYTMPIVGGAEVLLRYGDRTFRKDAGVSREDAMEILADLHETVAHLHRRGIVLGDFNDLNVLVRRHEAHLIDIDSVQFGVFPSTLFTARFLDPRLTDGAVPHPIRPPDADSDWFAFAVMAFQLLLFVHPYGGVHRPAQGGGGVPQDLRSLRRISVFHREVRYPRQAVPLAELSWDLCDYFRRVFERDVRGVFPLELLTGAAAPTIVPAVLPARVVRGRVIAEAVDALPVQREPRFWIEGSSLYREGSLGPELVGNVLAGQTRFWAGRTFGFGFYRAGEITIGFVFDANRRGIRDDVVLPRIRGQVIDATALFTSERCWFLLATHEEGRIRHRCTVLRRDGSVEATIVVEPTDGHWLAHIHGHAAAGESLLVATDDGIVRATVDAGTIGVTATFPDTQGLVGGGTSLVAAPDALYAVEGERVISLRWLTVDS